VLISEKKKLIFSKIRKPKKSSYCSFEIVEENNEKEKED
jgi:hypothetical protein